MIGHQIIMFVNCRILACFYTEECALFKFSSKLGEYGFCIVLTELLLKTVMGSCVWFCLQIILNKYVSMVCMQISIAKSCCTSVNYNRCTSHMYYLCTSPKTEI